MPELSKRRTEIVGKNGNDPAHFRVELARSRHRFELAADAVRQDFDALRALTQWRTIVRSRPFIALTLAVMAGAALGFYLALRRRDD